MQSIWGAGESYFRPATICNRLRRPEHLVECQSVRPSGAAFGSAGSTRERDLKAGKMNRREWLKMSAAAAGVSLWPYTARASDECGTCVEGEDGVAARRFELEIGETTTRMVDGVMVNQLAYRIVGSPWRIPGPVLRVAEGELVEVTILNRRQEAHGFDIPGVEDTRVEIDPGCSCTVRFFAPEGGTYLYHDPTGDTPLYRVLGLHGVMVSAPANGVTRGAKGVSTPYSLDKLPTAVVNNLTRLFTAFGKSERFPGGRWVPSGYDTEYSNQEKIWVLSEVDPRYNALVQPGAPLASNPGLTSDVVGNWTPRYFTMLNRSGFDLHDGDDVCPANYIGEPTLLRLVNAGLAHHAPHIHGNHVMRLSQANLDPESGDWGKVEVASNIFEVDTWAMWPMDRRDVLLPFEVPPDIPWLAFADHPATPQFERMVRGQAQEPFPLRYVMHDHVEMSQTAAGGNYPQGMVTHWEILGGVGGRSAAQARL